MRSIFDCFHSFPNQIPFQNERCRNGINILFMRLHSFAALVENVVGFYRSAALVPQANGKPGSLLQLLRKGSIEFRSRPLTAIHISRKAHHQLFNLPLGNQLNQLREDLLFPAALNHCSKSCQGSGQVGYGDARTGVAIIDSHDSHLTYFRPEYRSRPWEA